MDLGGYSNIPDTLPEAQAEIVRLLNEIKRRADIDFADSKITQSYAEKLFEVKKALLDAKQFADGWLVDAEGYATRVIPQDIQKCITAGLWWCDHDMADAARIANFEANR